jgi:hypothetical protein
MVKCKAIPIIDRKGPQCGETSRFAHFLDNRLTDDSEVVSLTRRLPFTPRKIPGTHFSYSSFLGIVAVVKGSYHLSRSWGGSQLN